MYPATADLIRKLSHDHWIGIASNCQEGYIETFFEASKLQDVVDSFISNGETGLDKDQNIRILMKRNGLCSAVYIGDTSRDRLCAEKSGIPFIWCRVSVESNPSSSKASRCSELK
ncbi:HAD family hydrolase [Faecalibaculum rodentium]|uniref:HAD family hydrolase n=3 Tax=Faecalibaculum rodentium TaxID=1702221 RepID=UPI003BEEC315